MTRRFAETIAVILICAAIWSAITFPSGHREIPAGGWGVDACLSCFVGPVESVNYLRLLETSGVRWLRERDMGSATDAGVRLNDPGSRKERLRVWRQERRDGFRVLAFASLPDEIPVEREEDQLPENLLEVFKQSRKLAQMADADVDAWEMNGEPDTAFLKDLPDRAVAYEKAVYLGLKAGAASGNRQVGVLMGALALPPGPWAERAARNGLYDYTDALNFHFYGRAGDLRDVIEAHREFARSYSKGRELPAWVTECGMDAVPTDRMRDAHGRDLQRAFTLETSAIARESSLCVFMPFILDYPTGYGFSMTESSQSTYPAWKAYAGYTQAHALPAAPAFAPPKAPSPVVLQWMPNEDTCIPQKVSGVYWFSGEGNAPKIEGEIIAYNFSDATVRGNLEVTVCRGVQMALAGQGGFSRKLAIPPLGRLHIPVSFAADVTRYLRGDVEADFRQGQSETSSHLVFGLETRPADPLLPLEFLIQGRQPGEDFAWIWAPEPYRVTSRGGPWVGVNGIEILNAGTSKATGALGESWSFRQEGPQIDPRLVPMAVTKVDGLPDVPDGFLRLRMPGEAPGRNTVRVDLVDAAGQRFTVFENLGQNAIDPMPEETFLSYRDFHVYIWGRCSKQPVFRPSAIREIQLRFYSQLLSKATVVQLDVVAPR